MEPKCHSERCADVLNIISFDTCDKQSQGLLSGYLMHQKEEIQSSCQWEKEKRKEKVLHTGKDLTKERYFQDPFSSSLC